MNQAIIDTDDRRFESLYTSPFFDINALDKNMTPLMTAVKYDKAYYVKRLLQHPNIDITIKDSHGKSVERNSTELIEYYFDEYMRQHKPAQTGVYNRCTPHIDSTLCNYVTDDGVTLGAGSFGKVKSIHGVAVKKLKIRRDSLIESTVGLVLDHKYLLKVKGIATSSMCTVLNGQPSMMYIFMNKMKVLSKMSTADKMTYADNTRHIISAIDFLYRHDILYTDIKPENVLYDKSFNFVLSDIGSCTYLNRQEFIIGRQPIIFTPTYCDPATYEIYINSTNPFKTSINIPYYMITIFYAELLIGTRVSNSGYIPDSQYNLLDHAESIETDLFWKEQLSTVKSAITHWRVTSKRQPGYEWNNSKYDKFYELASSSKYDLPDVLGDIIIDDSCRDTPNIPKMFPFPSDDLIFVTTAIHNAHIIMSKNVPHENEDITTMQYLLLDILDLRNPLRKPSEESISRVVALLDGIIRPFTIADFFNTIPELDHWCMSLFQYDYIRILNVESNRLNIRRVLPVTSTGKPIDVTYLPKFYSYLKTI
jgi:serine/threonine protein kinase